MLPPNKIYCGDCLEVMKEIDDGSIDMILCDLPYGTTVLKWDSAIPLDTLWEQYKRIIKHGGVVVLTGVQPFTSILVMSNFDWFRHEIIWEKDKGSNHLAAHLVPLKVHENVCVFYQSKHTYNPQKLTGCSPAGFTSIKKNRMSEHYDSRLVTSGGQTDRFPRSVLKINSCNSAHPHYHPTQKPVPLFEYLIRTYSNEGELVLDNCIGSGTTAIAALQTGRHFIGIEQSPEYCAIAERRIAEIDFAQADKKIAKAGMTRKRLF